MGLNMLKTFSLLCVASLVPSTIAVAPGALQRVQSVQMDTCSTCLLAVHILDDILCDPFIDASAVDWLIRNICPRFSDKTQCADMVRGLAPALVEWLRANASPDVLCADAGVCGNPSYKALLKAKPKSAKPNDMACPLCMYVVSKVKEQLGDPTTQEQIHDKSIAACGALPEGVMREACTEFVDDYEMTIFKYVNTMEASEVCQMIGTCWTEAAVRVPATALQSTAVRSMNKLMTLFTRPPSNDNCETCKIVIMELHTVLANPQFQAQLVDYAKQACGLIATLAEQCRADVDQYSPMVFGMVLAYLQPEQVCTEIKMCPAPSMIQQLSVMQMTLQNKYKYAFNKYHTAANALPLHS
eukprot:jgi/Chrzof1/7867/Cz02g39120.t1